MKERRKQLALGKVAGGAEDDENARVRNALATLGQLGNVFGADCHLHRCHGLNHLRRKDGYKQTAISQQHFSAETRLAEC